MGIFDLGQGVQAGITGMVTGITADRNGTVLCQVRDADGRKRWVPEYCLTATP